MEKVSSVWGTFQTLQLFSVFIFGILKELVYNIHRTIYRYNNLRIHLKLNAICYLESVLSEIIQKECLYKEN